MHVGSIPSYTFICHMHWALHLYVHSYVPLGFTCGMEGKRDEEDGGGGVAVTEGSSLPLVPLIVVIAQPRDQESPSGPLKCLSGFQVTN